MKLKILKCNMRQKNGEVRVSNRKLDNINYDLLQLIRSNRMGDLNKVYEKHFGVKVGAKPSHSNSFGDAPYTAKEVTSPLQPPAQSMGDKLSRNEKEEENMKEELIRQNHYMNGKIKQMEEKNKKFGKET